MNKQHQVARRVDIESSLHCEILYPSLGNLNEKKNKYLKQNISIQMAINTKDIN
jgi:hypothetical protein